MKLAVNVDHIATIREARQSNEPEPVLAALLAEQAGALKGLSVISGGTGAISKSAT